MRAALAVRVRVGDRGIWPAMVVLASLSAAAVCATWLLRVSGDMPTWLLVAAAGSSLLVVWLALGASRLRVVGLRWDTQAWQAQLHGGDLSVAGQLAVALDFGTWMLLRFDALDPSGALGAAALRRRPRRYWLPVRKAVVGTHWHALRCAVHARPPNALQPQQP